MVKVRLGIYIIVIYMTSYVSLYIQTGIPVQFGRHERASEIKYGPCLNLDKVDFWTWHILYRLALEWSASLLGQQMSRKSTEQNLP